MAEKKPGTGWNKSANDPNVYFSRVSRSPLSIGPRQIFTIKVNNINGSIDIYNTVSGAGDKLVTSFSPASNTWNKGEYFDETRYILGANAIEEIKSSSKKASIASVIEPTSTAENKAKILQSQGYKSSSSRASEGDEASSDGKSKKPETFDSVSDIISGVQDGSYRKKYDQLIKYPEDMDDKQDNILFTMYRYVAKQFSVENLNSGKDDGPFSSRKIFESKDIMGSVILPIQPQITDSTNVSWGDDTMNSYQARAAAAALNLMAGDVEGATNQLIKTIQGADAEATKALIAANLANRAATGDNGKLFTRLTGGILNPNVELLFNAPSLREFNFTFTLSSRSDSESQKIRKIIRFFKQGMSPKRSSSSLFLMSPNVFKIEYRKGSQNHSWINKIKECALKSFTVNYTPAGNYATYEDGSMTSYELSMIFGELDPIYDDDYTKLDSDADTNMGY